MQFLSSRKRFLGLAVLLGVAVIAAPIGSAADKKKTLKVGFAQTGAESDWRTANSESMISEAKKRGIDLKFSDGQGKQENQIRVSLRLLHRLRLLRGRQDGRRLAGEARERQRQHR